jgi:glycerophosphoryl diester phosphodiesterase
MRGSLNRSGVAICLAIWVAPIMAAGGFVFFEPVQPPRQFQIVVHGGAVNQAPAGSGPSLERCIQDGFEWVEIDIRLTKEGRHVLDGNAGILMGTNGSAVISDNTMAELKKVDIGSSFAVRYAGEAVLTLEECLALAKGKINLVLNCKSIDRERLVREVLDAGMERQVVVFDSISNLNRLNEIAHGRLALMAKWHPGLEPAAWVRSNNLAAVEVDANHITAAAAAAFHDLEVKVQANLLEDRDNQRIWDKVTRAGADWVKTDLPEELLAHALWQRVRHRPVLISLHRGASRYAPENTIPAFEKAIKLGADFVEFDVRTSSDGAFYLLHNSTLDGTTSGQGPIASATSSFVDSLSAGVKFGRPFAAVHLPTLDQFLGTVAGKVDLYFDAKAIAPEALAAAVDRHHMAERTLVYQSVPYLLRLKAIDPRIRALPSLASVDQLQTIADKLKPYAVDAKWTILSRELITRCHALGILVFSDALGEHETVKDYSQAMDWGIDLIQTDHPMRLLRAIELRAK